MSPIPQDEQGNNDQDDQDVPQAPLDEDMEPPPLRLTEYDEVGVVATLEELKIAQQFIAAVKEATLDKDKNLDSDARDRLSNPITIPFNLNEDPNLRAGIDIFLDTTNASDGTYNKVRESVNGYLRRLGVDPENSVPTQYSVKKAIGDLTGVYSMLNDMCIETCIAYTGPYADRDTCPHCGAPRYDPQKLAETDGAVKIPQRQFYTIPLGPQLQSIWRDPKGAKAMRHRVSETQKILEELRRTGEQNTWYDIYSGRDYIEAVQDGKIGNDDMVMMLSIDGAQLYQSKASDCWIYIWVVLDLPPDMRYKKRYVIPGGFIPGPNKPKNVDSFIFPGLHHACALTKEGLQVWDAYQDRVFLSKLFIFSGAADGPGMTYLNGLAGHSGAYGCRLYCPVQGRRKEGANHYYPALTKPDDYDVEGSNHGDVNADNLTPGSQDEYLASLGILLGARNQTNYQNLRRDTGISKPSIFSGFPKDRMLGVPACFGGDLMHLIALNLTELLLGLWRGLFDCDPQDSKDSWTWACLTGNTWKIHGKRVADATKFLPGSFDRPPRNPVEKITSGYKAWEFLTYVYGLGPGLFYHILPRNYWKNFCKLVRGIHILHQNTISSSQLVEGHTLLLAFVKEFEELYYQRKASRLHFCRQSIHALLHIAPEVTRIGPGVYTTQWCMERTIGILGQEIRQPSNPFQNLSERGLRRARINALENIIPDLTPIKHSPRVSEDLGDGYFLLGARDKETRYLPAFAIPAIFTYFTSIGYPPLPHWVPRFRRWARVLLPNKQIVRTAWKETSRRGFVRTARNIMVKLLSIPVTCTLLILYPLFSGLKLSMEYAQLRMEKYSFSSVHKLVTRSDHARLFLSTVHQTWICFKSRAMLCT